jgi:hypothetical protein
LSQLGPLGGDTDREMTLLNLLVDLADRGIRLAPAPGGLEIDGPRDALTPDLLARLRDHKQELLTLLRHPQPDAATTWQSALDRLADDPLFPPDVMLALRAAEVQWA